MFAGPAAEWGVEICKDMDFPAWSRKYGALGVRLLAVPSLDFGRDGRLHSRMAVTRGVENGYAVVRAAGQGLTISDAYGACWRNKRRPECPRRKRSRTCRSALARRSIRAMATGSAG